MAYKRTRVTVRYRPRPEKLMDQVREILCYHHYAIRIEQAYVSWILQFIRFIGKRHPKKMGKLEIDRFLSHLAMNRNVAPSTQNQAMTWVQRYSCGTSLYRPPYGAAYGCANRLSCRFVNIDIETCRECSGAVNVITCVEDPVVIENILIHQNE